MRRLLCVLLAGCGSGAPLPTQAGAPEPRVLSETQALVAMREALLAEGALPGGQAALTLDGVPLQAELRFGDPPFAIEWATDDDRAHAALPAPAPDAPLRIVSAHDDSGTVQVLVLDPRSYAFEANSLLVQRGAPSLEDAERKLRRDVAEFVDYVRDQGARL
jgi:hypothetical protein